MRRTALFQKETHHCGSSIITQSTHTSSPCNTEGVFPFSHCFYWCFCLLRGYPSFLRCALQRYFPGEQNHYRVRFFWVLSVLRACANPIHTGAGSDSGTRVFLMWKWPIWRIFHQPMPPFLSDFSGPRTLGWHIKRLTNRNLSPKSEPCEPGEV